MKQMQSSDKLTCLRTIEGTKQMEKDLHDRFRHAWSHAEWFSGTPDLIDFISSLPKNEHTGLEQRVRGPYDRHSANLNRRWVNGVFMAA